ncbi:MAG: hypothetical protein H6707_16975 [Deltaproteobacteria bacterium]|nr:hypothetical protein [Deltaproteobacteria bacterium]
MSTPRLALISCKALPKPDQDQQPLLTALAARGIETALLAWDDDTVRWQDWDLCVIRSTWNYYLQPERFLRWLSNVDRLSRLLNPLEIVSDNIDKRYLCRLAARGIATIPTEVILRDTQPNLEALAQRCGWSKVVIKPVVSAGSYQTWSMAPDDRQTIDALSQIHRRSDALVQPYLESFETPGERALVNIDGHWSHCVKKRPRFSGEGEAISDGRPLNERERAFGDRVLETIAVEHRPLLYARVDVVEDSSGELLLSELELTEPSLFLAHDDQALDRFVAAIEARLSGRSTSRASFRE